VERGLKERFSDFSLEPCVSSFADADLGTVFA
jgi:hypothetical protein